MGVLAMGSVRTRPETGLLFLDFKYQGQRMREQTALPDTVVNRKRLQNALERIETEIALGSFDYQKTFGKPLPTQPALADEDEAPQHAPPKQVTGTMDHALVDELPDAGPHEFSLVKRSEAFFLAGVLWWPVAGARPCPAARA